MVGRQRQLGRRRTKSRRIEDDKDSAWVHAYLHRVEGDLGNAGYWYRQAGKPVATGSLEAEWEGIVSALLELPRSECDERNMLPGRGHLCCEIAPDIGVDMIRCCRQQSRWNFC